MFPKLASGPEEARNLILTSFVETPSDKQRRGAAFHHDFKMLPFYWKTQANSESRDLQLQTIDEKWKTVCGDDFSSLYRLMEKQMHFRSLIREKVWTLGAQRSLVDNIREANDPFVCNKDKQPFA